MDLHIRDIPEELKRRAKSAAALLGISLREFVITAIREKVYGRAKQAKDARD